MATAWEGNFWFHDSKELLDRIYRPNYRLFSEALCRRVTSLRNKPKAMLSSETLACGIQLPDKLFKEICESCNYRIFPGVVASGVHSKQTAVMRMSWVLRSINNVQ
jgi:hypothetical protein